MKKIILFVCTFLCAYFSNAQPVRATSILGEWFTPKKDVAILIYQQGEQFFGKVVWANHKTGKDKNNPNPAKRNNEILGTTVLYNFVFDGKETWREGRIYMPINGKTFKCIIRVRNENTMELRGYIGTTWFGKTELLARR